jgi:hypothetical protein
MDEAAAPSTLAAPPIDPRQDPSAPVSDSIAQPESRSQRRQWVAPTLTRHESLTALTQMPQDPFGQYPPGMSPYGPGFTPYGEPIPCSQGFCP